MSNIFHIAYEDAKNFLHIFYNMNASYTVINPLVKKLESLVSSDGITTLVAAVEDEKAKLAAEAAAKADAAQPTNVTPEVTNG